MAIHHDVTVRPPRRAMRIAVVTETYPPEINGVAMTLGRMVIGLLQRGHELQLVRPRQTSEDAPRNSSPDNPTEEVLVRGLPIPGYAGLKFGLPSKGRLVKLWQARRPDLVHVVTEGPLGWSAVSAAKALSLPVSTDFHTNFHSYCRHYGFGWLKTLMSAYLRNLHNRSHATLVPTQALAGELESAGYRNLAVVSRGVDTEQFNPGRRSEELRSTWGVAPETLVVAYLGRLAPEKNLPVVVRAFNAIREKHPDVKLLFVGDGPLRAKLESSCPDAVFARMRVGHDLAAHFASADLFLFPSLTETFGNVTTEALASGLCVVAYDCAAAADLISNGHNGRTVPTGDEAAFIEAAVALAGDRDQLLKHRLRGPESVAHLDWELIHDCLARTLTDVTTVHERTVHPQPELAAIPD